MRPTPLPVRTVRPMRIASGRCGSGATGPPVRFRHGIPVERVRPPADGDFGVDADDALDRVVPGVTFEAAVGLEQAGSNPAPFGGAPQRLGLGRARGRSP